MHHRVRACHRARANAHVNVRVGVPVRMFGCKHATIAACDARPPGYAQDSTCAVRRRHVRECPMNIRVRYVHVLAYADAGVQTWTRTSAQAQNSAPMHLNVRKYA